MAADNASIALSWPKMVSFKLRSRFLSTSRSDSDTFFGGMRAIRATTFSIWLTVTEASRFSTGFRRKFAPRLVPHVDGLVGHVTIVDVARGEFRRRLQRIVLVLDAMMLLVTRLQA